MTATARLLPQPEPGAPEPDAPAAPARPPFDLLPAARPRAALLADAVGWRDAADSAAALGRDLNDRAYVVGHAIASGFACAAFACGLILFLERLG